MHQCINVRGMSPNEPGIIYCGRPCGAWPGSPLANLFRVSASKSLESVIQEYKRWLWMLIQAKVPAVMEALNEIGPESVLGCWCYTGSARILQPEMQICHTEVIWNAWKWLNDQCKMVSV